ncbi:DUF4097 family beta strand repeat-containing protein [Staphylococcus muscae]|uniref:Exported protein n=1 Tax=Staphylococcus muscae TaxID=1294 RepID=A0A240C809_9STAP|nr:DUF4097 family beta strand repeat-containing protein [Staphylococcus muscae]GGA87239.1 hypothetical protein GCM10007183_09230 [Staphylococcus muscae]SNW04090.1 exported protein [Staphylococcus muscae]
MKKFNLIVLILGLVFVLVGTIGAFYYSKVDNKYEEQEVNVSRTFDSKEIKNIDINLKKTHLSIVAGETLKLEGHGDGQQPNITTKGDTLKLELEGKENIQANVNVNPFHINKGANYTLTVPKSELSRLNITSEWGAVDVEKLNTKQMAVKMNKGAFDIEDSRIDKLEGQLTYGAFDLSGSQLEEVMMKVRKGSATLDDVPADIPMTLDNQLGEIDVTFAKALQNVSITTKNSDGNVDLEELTHYTSIMQQSEEQSNVIKIINNKGTVTLLD